MADRNARVAVVGAGDVGAAVLRRLAVADEVGHVLALDVDGPRASMAAADAAAIALYQDRTPNIEIGAVDVSDPDALDRAFTDFRPDAVVNAATLQSWWVITQLPFEQWRRLESEARFGPWIPFHLVPARWVMESLQRTAPGTPVVNIAFPDAVNPVLGKLGMAPTCGAGNSDLLRPGLTLAAARRLSVEPSEVRIELIAHHYHVVYFWMDLNEEDELDPSTFHLRVHYNGEDVSAELDVRSLMEEAGRGIPKGRAVGERTAASAVKNVRLLLGKSPVTDHATAPNGLAGGFDGLFAAGSIEILLPEGMDLATAVVFSDRAQLGDRIEAIEEDGSVRFTEASAGAMFEILGYDCPVLHPDEAYERAQELRTRLHSLIE